MQYVGLSTLAMAVLGPSFLGGFFYPLFFVRLAVAAYLGKQADKMTFRMWDQSTFPLTWCVFVPFVIGALVACQLASAQDL
jgi:hypothetical protein